MRLPCLLVILGIALVAVPASGDSVAVLEGESLAASGDVSLSGALVALEVDAAGDGTPSTFRLSAETLVVEMNRGQSPLVVGAAVQADSDREEDRWGRALVETDATGPYAALLVLPAYEGAAEARLDAAKVELAPPGRDHVEQPFIVPRERPPFNASLAGSLGVLHAGTPSVEVTGDLTIVLFDWAVGVAGVLEGAQRERAYWSGERTEEDVPNPVTPVGAGHERRVAYLFAYNATLTLAPAAASLNLAEPVLDVAGALTVEGARGTIKVPGGTMALGGDTAIMRGTFHVESTRAPHGLAAQVTGNPEGLEVGGTEVRWPVKQRPDLQAWWIPTALAALATAALLRKRGRRRMRAAIAHEDWPTAIRIANRLKKRRRERPGALLALATSLARSGRAQEAERVLDEQGWRVSQEAIRLYLLAHVLASQGRRKDALDALRRCLRIAPGLIGEVRQHALLDRLLSSDGVQTHSYH